MTVVVTWDTEVRGLGLRKNQASEMWILKYRVKERQVMVSLGPPQILDVISARALARRMKWEGRQGKGPPKQVRIPNLTIADFCKEYVNRYAKKHKRSWKKDQERCNAYIVPRLGKGKLLKSITQADIAELHDSISAEGVKKKPAPTAANRTVEQLQKMFRMAILWGRLPKDFDLPTVGIIRNKERNITRWLSDSELIRLIPVIESLPAHQSTFFFLLLMTGCRYSEVLKTQWRHVDLVGRRMWIPDTNSKNGYAHLVPLPAQAVTMLEALPKDTEWVFPGQNGDHFKRMDKVWRRIRGKVGLSDVRIHDFRHTTASQLIRQGVPLRVVGELLNHKSLSSTMKYAHVGKDQLESVMNTYATTIFSLSKLTGATRVMAQITNPHKLELTEHELTYLIKAIQYLDKEEAEHLQRITAVEWEELQSKLAQARDFR